MGAGKNEDPRGIFLLGQHSVTRRVILSLCSDGEQKKAKGKRHEQKQNADTPKIREIGPHNEPLFSLVCPIPTKKHRTAVGGSVFFGSDYFSAFSTIVSPLYEPQFEQTWCARFIAPHLGHFAMLGASSFQVLDLLESLRALDVFFFGTAMSDTPPAFRSRCKTRYVIFILLKTGSVL